MLYVGGPGPQQAGISATLEQSWMKQCGAKLCGAKLSSQTSCRRLARTLLHLDCAILASHKQFVKQRRLCGLACCMHVDGHPAKQCGKYSYEGGFTACMCLRSRLAVSKQQMSCPSEKIVPAAVQSCTAPSDLGQHHLWATTFSGTHSPCCDVGAFPCVSQQLQRQTA